MPVCTLEHRAIYYQTAGPAQAAATLLFIHGSGASSASWREQMADLTSDILGIAIDLPGHGLSPGPALSRVADLAAVVIDLLKQLAPPRPLFIAGHSLGAAVALQAACLEKDQIDALILLGGGARMRVLPAFLEGLAAGKADPGFFRLAFAPSADPAVVESELHYFAEVSANLLFHDFTACNEFDITDDLPLIELPVLVMVGDNDRLTPPKNSALLREKLPRADMVIIPDAGHFAMLEKPGQVNQAIHHFLRNSMLRLD